MPSTYRHDPDAALDYNFDWGSWLADGEAIVTQSVTLTEGDAAIGDPTQSGGTVTVFVSDAVVPLVRISCRITTSQGRKDDRTITLRVGNR